MSLAGAAPADGAGGPLAPQRRIEVVDALRGLALLGILQVNIQSYTWGPGDVLGYLRRPPQLVESALYFLQAAFIEGKCYPVFAFLFGLGAALQLRRMRRAPRLARARLRRRLGFLLGLGILHGLLLYFGDVLAAYAACAALVLLALPGPVPPRSRWLVRLAWAGACAALLGQLLPALLDDAAGAMPAPPLPAAAAAIDPYDAQASAIGRAHAIYAEAGFVEQLAQRRSDLFWQQIGGALAFWPQVICLVALGALAGRQGWLRHPRRHPRVWAVALGLGLGIGLPCSLLGAALDLQIARVAPGTAGDWNGVTALLGSLLAAAYVALAQAALQRPGAAPARRLLAAAGRVSLSNYLLQSLLMGALLSGWGLRWGAAASRGELALLGLALFALQAAASRRWLLHHAQGPMEALWRRWTYGAGHDAP